MLCFSFLFCWMLKGFCIFFFGFVGLFFYSFIYLNSFLIFHRYCASLYSVFLSFPFMHSILFFLTFFLSFFLSCLLAFFSFFFFSFLFSYFDGWFPSSFSFQSRIYLWRISSYDLSLSNHFSHHTFSFTFSLIFTLTSYPPTHFLFCSRHFPSISFTRFNFLFVSHAFWFSKHFFSLTLFLSLSHACALETSILSPTIILIL